MKTSWIIVFSGTYIVLSLSAYATTEDEAEEAEARRCNFSFAPHKINTVDGSKTICAKLFLDELTWGEAKVRCTLIFSQLTQRIYLNSSLYLELLDEGLDLLWIGIHRKANFFITEYPSKLFREATDFSPEQWGYHWSQGEPGLEDCVAIDVTTGSLLTRDCKTSLPFICENDDRLSSILHEETCPKRWMLSFALSSTVRTCIRQFKAHSYFKAKRVCEMHAGHLASSEEYDILYSSEQYTLQNFSIKTGKFWTQNGEQDEICIVKDLNNLYGGINKIFSENCSESYPFFCVKCYKSERVTVHLTPDILQPATTADSLDAADLLTCELEFDDQEDKHREALFQWYKDDLPVPSYSYVTKISFIGDALKRDPYTWDIATRQGNYHCEVTFSGSAKTYSSTKVKFVYSDVATFVIDIRNIKYINSLDYSHQDFTEYMEEFDDILLSSFLEKVKLQYSRVEWDFNSISVQNGVATMKILMYIHRNNVGDFDDSTVCEEVKKAFEGHTTVNNYLENVTFLVHCEDFPDISGYNSVMKSLKTFKMKLDSIEETQAEILEKLDNLELDTPEHRYAKPLPRGGESDFDIKLISRAAEELEQLKKVLFRISPEDPYLDETPNDRERNTLEDISPLFGSNKYRITSEESKRIAFINSMWQSPYQRTSGIVSEENKKFTYYPSDDSRDLEESERFYIENEP